MRFRAFAVLFLTLSFPARAEDLAVVGTGDGVEMLQAVATRFRQEEPSIDVKIPPSIGSGGGITAVGSGAAKLARVARPLSDAERARGLVYVPVAKIPSAFFVHPSAGISRLDSAQLTAIYGGRIVNWKDVGGADMRIRVVRREDADSTLGALRADMPGWRDLAITERSKTAVSTQEAVESVRLTEGAIGFGPYSRLLDVGTVVLTIDGHHPSQPGYPSNNELAYVHRADALAPEAEKFIAFSKTKAAGEILRGFGAVPSSP
jgi:phosphate transport system substrate-binding protein